MREHGDAVAERLGIDVGVIAADISGLLERAHAAQARRGGNAGAARQLDIGHAAVVLQVPQYPPVDPVEPDVAHGEGAPLQGFVLLATARAVA